MDFNRQTKKRKLKQTICNQKAVNKNTMPSKQLTRKAPAPEKPTERDSALCQIRIPVIRLSRCDHLLEEIIRTKTSHSDRGNEVPVSATCAAAAATKSPAAVGGKSATKSRDRRRCSAAAAAAAAEERSPRHRVHKRLMLEPPNSPICNCSELLRRLQSSISERITEEPVPFELQDGVGDVTTEHGPCRLMKREPDIVFSTASFDEAIVIESDDDDVEHDPMQTHQASESQQKENESSREQPTSRESQKSTVDEPPSCPAIIVSLPLPKKFSGKRKASSGSKVSQPSMEDLDSKNQMTVAVHAALTDLDVDVLSSRTAESCGVGDVVDESHATADDAVPASPYSTEDDGKLEIVISNVRSANDVSENVEHFLEDVEPDDVSPPVPVPLPVPVGSPLTLDQSAALRAKAEQVRISVDIEPIEMLLAKNILPEKYATEVSRGLRSKSSAPTDSVDSERLQVSQTPTQESGLVEGEARTQCSSVSEAAAEESIATSVADGNTRASADANVTAEGVYDTEDLQSSQTTIHHSSIKDVEPLTQCSRSEDVTEETNAAAAEIEEENITSASAADVARLTSESCSSRVTSEILTPQNTDAQVNSPEIVTANPKCSADTSEPTRAYKEPENSHFSPARLRKRKRVKTTSPSSMSAKKKARKCRKSPMSSRTLARLITTSTGKKLNQSPTTRKRDKASTKIIEAQTEESSAIAMRADDECSENTKILTEEVVEASVQPEVPVIEYADCVPDAAEEEIITADEVGVIYSECVTSPSAETTAGPEPEEHLEHVSDADEQEISAITAATVNVDHPPRTGTPSCAEVARLDLATSSSLMDETRLETVDDEEGRRPADTALTSPAQPDDDDCSIVSIEPFSLSAAYDWIKRSPRHNEQLSYSNAELRNRLQGTPLAELFINKNDRSLAVCMRLFSELLQCPENQFPQRVSVLERLYQGWKYDQLAPATRSSSEGECDDVMFPHSPSANIIGRSPDSAYSTPAHENPTEEKPAVTGNDRSITVEHMERRAKSTHSSGEKRTTNTLPGSHQPSAAYSWNTDDAVASHSPAKIATSFEMPAPLTARRRRESDPCQQSTSATRSQPPLEERWRAARQSPSQRTCTDGGRLSPTRGSSRTENWQVPVGDSTNTRKQNDQIATTDNALQRAPGCSAFTEATKTRSAATSNSTDTSVSTETSLSSDATQLLREHPLSDVEPDCNNNDVENASEQRLLDEPLQNTHRSDFASSNSAVKSLHNDPVSHSNLPGESQSNTDVDAVRGERLTSDEQVCESSATSEAAVSLNDGSRSANATQVASSAADVPCQPQQPANVEGHMDTHEDGVNERQEAAIDLDQLFSSITNDEQGGVCDTDIPEIPLFHDRLPSSQWSSVPLQLETDRDGHQIYYEPGQTSSFFMPSVNRTGQTSESVYNVMNGDQVLMQATVISQQAGETKAQGTQSIHYQPVDTLNQRPAVAFCPPNLTPDQVHSVLCKSDQYSATILNAVDYAGQDAALSNTNLTWSNVNPHCVPMNTCNCNCQTHHMTEMPGAGAWAMTSGGYNVGWTPTPHPHHPYCGHATGLYPAPRPPMYLAQQWPYMGYEPYFSRPRGRSRRRPPPSSCSRVDGIRSSKESSGHTRTLPAKGSGAVWISESYSPTTELQRQVSSSSSSEDISARPPSASNTVTVATTDASSEAVDNSDATVAARKDSEEPVHATVNDTRDNSPVESTSETNAPATTIQGSRGGRSRGRQPRSSSSTSRRDAGKEVPGKEPVRGRGRGRGRPRKHERVAGRAPPRTSQSIDVEVHGSQLLQLQNVDDDEGPSTAVRNDVMLSSSNADLDAAVASIIPETNSASSTSGPTNSVSARPHNGGPSEQSPAAASHSPTPTNHALAGDSTSVECSTATCKTREETSTTRSDSHSRTETADVRSAADTADTTDDEIDVVGCHNLADSTNTGAVLATTSVNSPLVSVASSASELKTAQHYKHRLPQTVPTGHVFDGPIATTGAIIRKPRSRKQGCIKSKPTANNQTAVADRVGVDNSLSGGRQSPVSTQSSVTTVPGIASFLDGLPVADTSQHGLSEASIASSDIGLPTTVANPFAQLEKSDLNRLLGSDDGQRSAAETEDDESTEVDVLGLDDDEPGTARPGEVSRRDDNDGKTSTSLATTTPGLRQTVRTTSCSTLGDSDVAQALDEALQDGIDGLLSTINDDQNSTEVATSAVAVSSQDPGDCSSTTSTLPATASADTDLFCSPQTEEMIDKFLRASEAGDCGTPTTSGAGIQAVAMTSNDWPMGSLTDAQMGGLLVEFDSSLLTIIELENDGVPVSTETCLELTAGDVISPMVDGAGTDAPWNFFPGLEVSQFQVVESEPLMVESAHDLPPTEHHTEEDSLPTTPADGADRSDPDSPGESTEVDSDAAAGPDGESAGAGNTDEAPSSVSTDISSDEYVIVVDCVDGDVASNVEYKVAGDADHHQTETSPEQSDVTIAKPAGDDATTVGDS